jgi:hypothetical protein
MKWVVVLLAVSGCFNPQVQSGDFACNPPEHPECPQGFTCVNNLCIEDSEAANLPVADLSDQRDLARPPLVNPSMPPKTVVDLGAPADLSPLAARPDLAQPMCVATGGDCTYHNDAVCCSSYCIYSTNKCK